jgi:metallo-beta-lactamase family protein
MSVKIHFLGASGTVTGSKYLVEYQDRKILVDAGMFQGERKWRDRNWNAPDFAPGEIDAVLLTHAHIDHTGMLPRFYSLGLKCPVYCTNATLDLCRLVLPDSGRLQEEEAEYRGKSGRSRHHPPLPLYTEDDAIRSLDLFKTVPFDQKVPIMEGVKAEWRRMGHILGAACIQLEVGGRSISFSGDVGRYAVPILKDPQPMNFGDLLLIESTYGDKEHREKNPLDALAKVINATARKGGTLLIPSFAIGRCQLLLYYLRELKERKAIPDIPVIVDSPMASDATQVYTRNPEDYDEEALGILKHGRHPFHVNKMHFVRDRNESKALNSIREPMILISASGMLTGGRVLHHLMHRVTHEENTILFVGHQPEGGRGDWLKKGNPTVRIFGEEVPVRAEISEISGLSAHGDREELLRWCRSCSGKPSRVAVVHGEPETAATFRDTLAKEFSWNAFTPSYLQTIEV